jgi:hypothetical protein
VSWEACGGYPRPGIGSVRELDRAWVVLDELATEAQMGGSVRDALYVRLREMLTGEQWEPASLLLAAFVDCWPLATMVDDARRLWAEESDPWGLAVLARSAEVISLAIGWSAGPGGPWPVPDDGWVSDHERSWLAAPPQVVQGLVSVTSAEVVERRAEIVSDLVRGQAAALEITGAPDDRSGFALAMGEVRMEASHQENFERFGHAGLFAERALSWSECLESPVPGCTGDVMIAIAEGLLMPGPISAVAAGTPDNVGWLLWNGPHPPCAVHPLAIGVLQALDGVSSQDKLRRELKIDGERLSTIMEALVRVGAVTAQVVQPN